MAGRPLRRARLEAEAGKLSPPRVWNKVVRRSWGEAKAPEIAPTEVPPEADPLAALVGESATLEKTLTADSRDKFKDLFELSLNRSLDIMNLSLDPDDRNFPKLLASQEAIAKSTFAIMSRINDGELKKQQNDRIGQLLEKVRATNSAASTETDAPADDLLAAALLAE